MLAIYFAYYKFCRSHKTLHDATLAMAADLVGIMNTFLKMSGLALLAQIVFIAQMFITGIGDGVVYFLYGMPFFLLDSIVKLPAQIGGDSAFVALLLLCVPALFYSVLLGGTGCLFRRVLKRKLQD